MAKLKDVRDKYGFIQPDQQTRKLSSWKKSQFKSHGTIIWTG